jgi:hypothetical protein
LRAAPLVRQRRLHTRVIARALRFFQTRHRSGATPSARSREPRPRQAPPGAAARSHSSTRIPEPLVELRSPSSRFMRAPAVRTSGSLTSRADSQLSRHDAFQHQDHRDEECPSARPEDDDRERPFARIDGPSYFSRNDAVQAARHRDEDSRWRASHQSRSSRCGTSVEEKRSREHSSESTNFPAAAVHWSASAAATATRALPPALRDSDAHRSSFAAALRASSDAKNSRRGMPHARLSGGTNAVGLELTTAKLLRRRQPRATTRPDRTSATTIACLKEGRHDHIQVARCR